MKIVFIQSYEHFPDFRLYREVALARQVGAECHIIVWQHSETGALVGELPGVTVHRIKIAGRHGMGCREHLTRQPRFYRAVYETLAELDPGIIIAHNLDSAFPAVLYRLMNRLKPLIYVSREPYHKVFRMKTGSRIGEAAGWLMDAFCARASSSVMAVTPRMVEMYRRMGVKAAWMPNAPLRATCMCAEGKTVRDTITVGFVGNLRLHCGIEEMGEALSILARRYGKKYRMLLRGIPLAGFEKTIERMQRENPGLIQVLPPCAPSEVARLYREIDIAFQLPFPTEKYRRYGLNVKVFESLATGTPAVISTTSENPLLLKDSGAVYIVEDTRPETVASAVERLGENPSLRAEMGKKGKEFILSRFNWEMFEGEYRDILTRLMRSEQTL